MEDIKKMKKLNNLKWFSLGVIVCLLVTILVVPTFASTLNTTAQLIYNDIKITLNGSSITPKDANGNAVEAFTIDGTTYLPVRAVSTALGLDVNWNSATKTVELTSPSELIAAPDTIYTTTHDVNGYGGMLMYTKGSIQSKSTLQSGADVLYINTSKGMLVLANPFKSPSFSSLVAGNTYTFTFVYYTNSTSPIIPGGVYISSK